jgi:hypothetical protein
MATVPCKDLAGKKVAEGDIILVSHLVPHRVTKIVPSADGRPALCETKTLPMPEKDFPVASGTFLKAPKGA